MKGSWPTVAISKEGYVIVVFSDQIYKNGSDLNGTKLSQFLERRVCTFGPVAAHKR